MVFSNYSLLKLLCLGLCFAYASATPTSQTQNSTVDLPVGTSNHGDSKLICIPAKWSDIITFYLGNYVAHVITIISYPGASTMETIIAVISAFLLPGAGIFRALRAIFSKSRFAEDDLRAAARAGALCTLIDESKLPGDKSPGWWKLVITGSALNDPNVHGSYEVPEGFALVVLPPGAQFEPYKRQDAKTAIKLCNNYNTLKIFVSLGQALFAAGTLYETRGDQISRYGYAAFGLTVTPYIWMSLLNLCGNYFCAEYPSFYLIESQAMRDLTENEGICFTGVVAKLTKEYDEKLPRLVEEDKEVNLYYGLGSVLALLLGLIPIAVVGGLTSFRKGHSTGSQRAWLMTWLVFGMFVGPWAEAASSAAARDDAPWSAFFFLFLFAAPSIGGLVVVGSMIREYGVCSAL